MNHDASHCTQVHRSHRSALRWHKRRPALPLFSERRNIAHDVVTTPTTVLGLPNAMVRDAGMLELLAAELRIAELESALAAARADAFADPLTGALNRRGLENASRRELARAHRTGTQIAIAHIDLDDFKDLNDTYGHEAGDKALVHLVALFHQSMRPTDLLGRFGGEEFVLMLPDTSVSDAAAVLARFQSEFSARPIAGTDCTMSFSAGVVAHGVDELIEETIRRADAATYVAKRAGKNCVVTG